MVRLSGKVSEKGEHSCPCLASQDLTWSVMPCPFPHPVAGSHMGIQQDAQHCVQQASCLLLPCTWGLGDGGISREDTPPTPGRMLG